MTFKELRDKYPKFIYEKYEYESKDGKLEIKFYYSISEHKFLHRINFAFPESAEIQEQLIFQLGISLIPSYWKTTCSQTVEIQAGSLSDNQKAFWHKLFIRGMGEYFYKNQIDFTDKDFISIISENNSPGVNATPSLGKEEGGGVLVPIGGGKDSIVTIELLKNKHSVIPFIVNPVSVMHEICRISGLTPVIVNSTIDPYLISLNKKGFLNGHVPVSAFYTFSAVLIASIMDIKFIAFSNERSSSEGNTEYLGQDINHQYSKSFEFETDLKQYLSSIVSSPISVFSFVRPLYELQIAKLFSQYPQYFNAFTSCNNNFKLKNFQPAKWCGTCPKCISTALMLNCFLGRDKVIEIMGSFPPDLPGNQVTTDQLTGLTPVKPFECVLTRDEAIACVEFLKSADRTKLDQFSGQWLENPNMPEQFSQLLKTAVT